MGPALRGGFGGPRYDPLGPLFDPPEHPWERIPTVAKGNMAPALRGCSGVVPRDTPGGAHLMRAVDRVHAHNARE